MAAQASSQDSKQETGQAELFPDYAPKTGRAERFPALAKPPKTVLITATTEQIFFTATAAVLALCLVFFSGRASRQMS